MAVGRTVRLKREWRGHKPGTFLFNVIEGQATYLVAQGLAEDVDEQKAKAMDVPRRDKMVRSPARKKGF